MMPLNQAFKGIHVGYKQHIVPHINMLDNRIIKELANEVNE